MYFAATAFVTALSLAGLSAAAPTPQSSDCSVFPWFIAPYTDSQDCSTAPAYYQPTSGPYDPNATSTGCRSLWDPNGAPQSFQSVSINRDACPQQQWAIYLYVDSGCGTNPVVVQNDVCVPSPGTNAAGQFRSFQAIRLT